MLSASFDVTVRSTVTEETTWADFTRAVINYSNPSIPAQSTIETYPSTTIAGTTYTITMQSRNIASTALAWDNDTYTVILTRTDGGGLEQYIADVTHQANGLY